MLDTTAAQLILYTLTFLCVLNNTEGFQMFCIAKDEGNNSDLEPCNGTYYDSIETLCIQNCSQTVIKLFNKENYMSKIVSFVGCDQLTIEGNEDKATQIICNTSDSGFYFDNVKHLTFQNIEMFSCGYKHRHLNIKSSTAIHFYECTNVIVQNVSFVQSLYTSIVFSDTTGKVDLNDSHFLNTSMTKHSIEAESLFLRGVYIQFQRVLSPTAYAFTNCV